MKRFLWFHTVVYLSSPSSAFPSTLSWLRKLNANSTNSLSIFTSSEFLRKQLPHPSSSSVIHSHATAPPPLPLTSSLLLLPLPCVRTRTRRRFMCANMLSLQHDMDEQGRLTLYSTRLLSPFLSCKHVHKCECACNTSVDYSYPPSPTPNTQNKQCRYTNKRSRFGPRSSRSPRDD